MEVLVGGMLMVTAQYDIVIKTIITKARKFRVMDTEVKIVGNTLINKGILSMRMERAAAEKKNRRPPLKPAPATVPGTGLPAARHREGEVGPFGAHVMQGGRQQALLCCPG